MKLENFDGKDLTEVLKMFAPGTAIRVALDDLMRARMGALIVLEKEGINDIMEGGFRVNVDFSPQKLVELAKMDGAIILSSDMKKIIYANIMLVPDMKIKSNETGTRHKSAERTAKQIKTITVAVSERKNKITVYYDDESYVLDESSEILRRATETLQILEKQKDIFDELLIHLNISEVTYTTTIGDVSNVLQRMEIINRISEIIRGYLIELGKEGAIASMRLRELTKNFNRELEFILRDYSVNPVEVRESLDKMSFDFLLDLSNISKILFTGINDEHVSPKGIRILSKINLSEENINLVINEFKSLNEIFDAPKESFVKIFKEEGVADLFVKNLNSLKEKILDGKGI